MVFNRWDGIKEFERMRQALKSAERFATPVAVSDVSPPTSLRAASPPAEIATNVQNNLEKESREATMAVSSSVHAVAQKPSEQFASIVSSGSTFQGSLKVDDSVRIEGQVTGEIEAHNTVYVAEGAQVDAKVRAAFVVIAGQFQGEVVCGERLEILPTGCVRALLTTKSLVVHEGAFIDGQIHMTNERPANADPISILDKLGSLSSSSPDGAPNRISLGS